MPPRSRTSLLAIAIALGLVALIAAGCRTEQTAGPAFPKRTRTEAGDPRSYLLGFSDTPWAMAASVPRLHGHTAIPPVGNDPLAMPARKSR